MEIIHAPRLKFTNEELDALKKARNILSDICWDCECDSQSCPLFGLCPASTNNPSTIDEILGKIIISKVVTE